MRCGARCFLVQFEVDGVRREKTVRARTPAAVRKAIRGKYNGGIEIYSVASPSALQRK